LGGAIVLKYRFAVVAKELERIKRSLCKDCEKKEGVALQRIKAEASIWLDNRHSLAVAIVVRRPSQKFDAIWRDGRQNAGKQHSRRTLNLLFV
jgi:hypothetical protein